MTLETVDFLGNTLAHAGERITTKPSILGGLVLFPSYIPGTDICTMEGTSNLYALGYTTGSAVSTPTSHFIFKKEESLYTGMSQSQLQTKSVSRTALLGKGLPASIGLAVTKEGKLKGFVQSSTGDIQPIQDISPQAPRSGYTGWKTQGLGGER
jgi:type IV pilus assembly protein PilY1